MTPPLASLCRQLALISFGKSTEPTRAAHHEMEGIFGTAQELPGSTTIEVGTSARWSIFSDGPSKATMSAGTGKCDVTAV